MEKETLLKIILQDIKELDSLINSFTGKPNIPDAFIRLSKNKVKGILDEIELLESISNSSTMPESPATEKKAPVIEEKIKEDEIFVIEEKQDEIPPPIVVENKKTPIEKKEVKAETVQPPVKETKTEQSTPPVTLGDKLMTGNQSLYDTLSKEKSATSLFQQPVKDIKSAIGINDRFYFQRELFEGNAELFNSAVEQLNSMENMESAMAFLAGNFTWDEDNDAVKSFMDIVKRRYL